MNQLEQAGQADRKKVDIYTDGACSGNPGPGGWAAVLLYNRHKKEISGFVPDTTNNRMELTAAIRGLEALKMPCDVALYSDSSYLVNAFEKKWIEKWIASGFREGKDRRERKNTDLWKTLLVLMETQNVRYIKVPGHADNEYNNRCDRLATGAISSAGSRP